MEFDQQTDRLPFHDPDEAEQGRAGATVPSGDGRIRHLQRVPLFSGFNEAELRRVVELSRIVEAPAGTVVTQVGEPGDSFCIIIDGAVAVRTPVGTGSELHPGDFFGEMSLLDGEPRSATILATTDLRLLSVDRAHFWRLLDETPELVRRILTILSRRVRRLEQTVHAMLHGTNPTRRRPAQCLAVPERIGSIQDARRLRASALKRMAMEREIGDGAGMIWQYLHEHGPATLGRLRQGTKLSEQLLLMGVGWPAREDKVSIDQQGRTVKVSLREG